MRSTLLLAALTLLGAGPAWADTCTRHAACHPDGRAPGSGRTRCGCS